MFSLLPDETRFHAANVLLFFQPEALGGIVPSISDACLQPYKVLQVALKTYSIADKELLTLTFYATTGLEI